MNNNQCNDNKFYLHNFKNNKPPTENLKNTINERIQNFMFNPYTFQRSNETMTAPINRFGASSNSILEEPQQLNNHQTNHQRPNYQQLNHKPIDTSSMIFNENRRLNEEIQTSERNDVRIMNYSALNRNLDIPYKKYVPFYEHRPIDTTQEYLEDPVEHSDFLNKFDK